MLHRVSHKMTVGLAGGQFSRPGRNSFHSSSVLCPGTKMTKTVSVSSNCPDTTIKPALANDNCWNYIYYPPPTEPIECEFVHRHLDGIVLVDARPEVVRVPSERDLQQRQEAVHPGQQTLGTAGRNSLLPPRERDIYGVRLQFVKFPLAPTCWLRCSWRECRQTR